MKKLIIASNNKHKIKELKEILNKYNLEVFSLNEAGIDIEIEENGVTFEENSMIKAKAIRELKKDCMVLADDSGLMVDALNGEPGVYSARFAGEHGNYSKNNEKLLKMLQGKAMDERKAKFVCVITLIVDDNNIIQVRGEVQGYINDRLRGKQDFGYDPLFLVPKYNMTFAEMDTDLKNSISHRAEALKKLEKEIGKVF